MNVNPYIWKDHLLKKTTTLIHTYTTAYFVESFAFKVRLLFPELHLPITSTYDINPNDYQNMKWRPTGIIERMGIILSSYHLDFGALITRSLEPKIFTAHITWTLELLWYYPCNQTVAMEPAICLQYHKLPHVSSTIRRMLFLKYSMLILLVRYQWIILHTGPFRRNSLNHDTDHDHCIINNSRMFN